MLNQYHFFQFTSLLLNIMCWLIHFIFMTVFHNSISCNRNFRIHLKLGVRNHRQIPHLQWSWVISRLSNSLSVNFKSFPNGSSSWVIKLFDQEQAIKIAETLFNDPTTLPPRTQNSFTSLPKTISSQILNWDKWELKEMWAEPRILCPVNGINICSDEVCAASANT